MYWLVIFMSLSLVGLVGLGMLYDRYPQGPGFRISPWWRGVIGVNLLTFVVTQAGILFLVVQDAMAQEPEVAATAPKEISIGMGLSLIGIGLPTAAATLAAGLAVGTVGASALAAVSEKPELFGRTLIYLGLAEGIAIYGVLVTILMLGKV
jgi:V/A-type H+/Na+-transporting ATPase subunit K